MLIEFAGRSILLTGDLEGRGLDDLLAKPPHPVDILLAPHHGSRRSNSPELAEWAQPKWVVVSGPRNRSTDILRNAYGEGTHVLATAVEGAIHCEIDESGTVRVETFRRPSKRFVHSAAPAETMR